MGRTLTQRSGPANDNVMTPFPLAHAIVEHFNPRGRCLDPCCGDGAFGNAMARHRGVTTLRMFDIRDGASDFLTFKPEAHFDWIITNPPWSKMRAFRRKAMEVADNVVFLCSPPVWFYNASREDMRRAGFGLRELFYVPQPPKPWPSSGLGLAAGWIQRGWFGSVKIDQTAMPLKP